MAGILPRASASFRARASQRRLAGKQLPNSPHCTLRSRGHNTAGHYPMVDPVRTCGFTTYSLHPMLGFTISGGLLARVGLPSRCEYGQQGARVQFDVFVKNVADTQAHVNLTMLDSATDLPNRLLPSTSTLVWRACHQSLLIIGGRPRTWPIRSTTCSCTSNAWNRTIGNA